ARRVGGGVDEEGPAGRGKFLEAQLRAVEIEGRLVALDARHEEADHRAAASAAMDRARRPCRELQQALAAELRHGDDLGGFLGARRVVIELGHEVVATGEREHAALAAPAELGAQTERPAAGIKQRKRIWLWLHGR